jgi:hypothetical protein
MSAGNTIGRINRMKTIICGPRDFTDYEELCLAIEKSGIEITEVVSGSAKGADALGERWARENGVKYVKFKAEWKDIDHPEAIVKENAYGKYNAKAGPIRNEKMTMYAEACIAIDTGSNDSADMIRKAKEKELELYCHAPYESDILDAAAEVEF